MPKKKQLTSRQKQAIESRKKLVTAATELFNQHGYQDTAVQDICAKAGLSVGVFYHYFASKQDALHAVLAQKTTELMVFISEESISQNHVEAILEVFGFVCRQQTTGSFELVCNTFAPTLGKQLERDPKLKEFVADIIRSGQAVGEFTDEFDYEDIAEDLLTSARGYVFYWCEEGGSFDVCRAQHDYLCRILRAYLGPNGTLKREV